VLLADSLMARVMDPPLELSMMPAAPERLPRVALFPLRSSFPPMAAKGPVPSEANFVFMVVGPDAEALSDELLRMGVIVRPLGWMGFPEAIRISVGTAEENDKCLSAMARVILKRAGEGELAAR